MPTPRDRKRRDWPRGLYENPPGYYRWRHPTTGQMITLGRIALADARNQALEANAFVLRSKVSLVDKLRGADKTVADALAAMPAADRPNTAKHNRYLDGRIAEALGTSTQLVTVDRRAAALVWQPLLDEGKARAAQALRSRLSSVMAKAVARGWIPTNPVQGTEKPNAEPQRARLTLETYFAVRCCATQWLATAMDLLLLTQSDRDTVVGLRRSVNLQMLTPPGAAVPREHLVLQRAKTRKTNSPVAIPTTLTLRAAGLVLSEVVHRDTGVASDYLVHHITAGPKIAPGDPVFHDRVTKEFTAARRRAGVPDEIDGRPAPTFYEIKSLSKRLFKAQGDVNTRVLGSHTAKTDALYADPRGAEPVFVPFQE